MSVGQRLAAGDHSVNENALPGFAQVAIHAVLEKVVPQRNELVGAVIDHEGGGVISDQNLDEIVKGALVASALLQHFQLFGWECPVLGQRLVDGVGVDASYFLTPLKKVLSAQAGNEALAHTALSLQ